MRGEDTTSKPSPSRSQPSFKNLLERQREAYTVLKVMIQLWCTKYSHLSILESV